MAVATMLHRGTMGTLGRSERQRSVQVEVPNTQESMVDSMVVQLARWGTGINPSVRQR